jgi:uncharacterized protein (TIGR02996 family)
MARKKSPSPDEAFLRAICEEPDDDTHRLVYADWLDEHGQPERAEFIRVQCALAKLGPDAPRPAELAEREQALYEAHHRAWFDELPEWARPRVYGTSTFRRGFVAGIFCTARQWLKGAEALLRQVPPERLTLYKCKGVMAEVSRSPSLAGVWALGLHELGSGAELRELVKATHLTRITEFHLEARPLDDEAGAILPRLPFLSRLRRLVLRCRLGDTGARLLVETPALARLESLDLSFNHLGTGTVAALASSPHLAGLHHLELRSNLLDAEAARRLAASTTIKHLAELDLASNPIGSDGLRALAESPLIEGLTYLRLANTEAGPEGAEALAATGRPTRLAHLDLLEAGIGDRGAVALARSPVLATVRDLNLYGNDIGPDGAVALAAAPYLGNLESLRLNGRAIGNRGALALANAPHLPRLRQLNVSAEGLSKGTQQRLQERFGYKVWS